MNVLYFSAGSLTASGVYGSIANGDHQNGWFLAIFAGIIMLAFAAGWEYHK